MKTAIVLTGHMRNWKFLFPKFKEDFIDKFNADVFISTWNNEGFNKVGSVKGVDCNSPDLDVRGVIDSYKPKSIIVENYDDLEQSFISKVQHFKTAFQNTKNIASMFYKIKSGMQLVTSYAETTNTKYDLVIRCRPDIYKKFPFPEFDPNVFLTTYHKNFYENGTGDAFHVTNYNDMVRFSQVYDSMDLLYNMCGLICPHVFTKKWIDHNRFQHQEVDNPLILYNKRLPKFFLTDFNQETTIIHVGMHDSGTSRTLMVKPKTRLFGFEPVKQIFNWVIENVIEREPRLIPLNFAVDIESKYKKIYIAGYDKWHFNSLFQFTDNINQLWSSDSDNKHNFHFNGEDVVRTIRLDEFIKLNHISQIDYLLVDACGSDLNVLKSLGDCANIVMEGKVHSSANLSMYKDVDNSLEGVISWLTDNNFDYFIDYDHEIYKNEAYVHFFKKTL